MKAAPLALLCVLGPLSIACFENRPIVVGGDGGAPSQNGASGSGQVGSPGTAGTLGIAGTSGTAGTPSTTTAVGCDISQLVTVKYTCTIQGACHDANRSATGLDMVSPGWEQKLIGTLPSNGSLAAIPSECLGVNEPYLIAGSSPARGLFLDKLTSNPPCGVQMPNLGSHVTVEDFDCFQRWANALTASTQTGAAGAGGTTTSGTAGTSGTAVGCDVTALFGGPSGQTGKYLCTIAGACHDASPTAAAGLDMVTPGWAQKLVGALPSQAPSSATPSMCLGSTEPYLIKGSSPARGLFLDKLKQPTPCGYVMPNIGPTMTPTDLDCVQRWADALTSQ